MILWMLLGAWTGGIAQSPRPPVAAAYTGFGAYDRTEADVFSFTANPASLASVKRVSLGVFGERKYLLPELSQYSLVAAGPVGPGAFGVEGVMSGSLAFRETRLGLAYARGLGKKIDAGVFFGYHSIAIGEAYGSAGTITAAAGVRMQLNDRLRAGVRVYHPAGGKFGKYQEEQLSSLYSFGWGYAASSQFYLEAVIEKETDQPVNVKMGWQYKIHPVIQIRAGISASTGSGWMGVAYHRKQLRIDVTATVHPQLGWSPGLLLMYKLPSRKIAAENSGT